MDSCQGRKKSEGCSLHFYEKPAAAARPGRHSTRRASRELAARLCRPAGRKHRWGEPGPKTLPTTPPCGGGRAGFRNAQAFRWGSGGAQPPRPQAALLRGNFLDERTRELRELPRSKRGTPRRAAPLETGTVERHRKSAGRGVQPRENGQSATADQRSCHLFVDLPAEAPQGLEVFALIAGAHPAEKAVRRLSNRVFTPHNQSYEHSFFIRF